MKFSLFAKYLEKIERTSSRNEMTEILAELLKAASKNEIKELIYLSLSNLGPLFSPIEFGISDKILYKIAASAFEIEEKEVRMVVKHEGDFGTAVGKMKKSTRNRGGHMTVKGVFDELTNIAQKQGSGSQEEKIKSFSKLLKQLDSRSAKYVVRIPLGKLRLGFSDVTLLDALSWMVKGDKSLRTEIERAYNVSADIGMIAKKVKEDGVKSLREVKVEVGVPIRPAAAERLPGTKEIIEKLATVMAEPKIDGFRLQCHFAKKSEFVRLYSRNLEDMTHMFPEIVGAIKKLKVKEIIFEGEAVAYNPDSGDFLPFQATVQRRRKHNIKEIADLVPLKLFAFDLLYLDGKPYLGERYTERRKALSQKIPEGKEVLQTTEIFQFDDPDKLASYFNKQIEHGLEGIMAKRLNGTYSAGARNFNWVKLKREDKGALTDSIDCLIMGYKFGTGKRSDFGIGAFLVGVYDDEEDFFRTISNVGTGLTDDQWREMKKRADEIKVDQKPARYDVAKELNQDVWVKPSMVVEILADEITRSPLHSAGKQEDENGYALRFPRLVKWRDDKRPEQATSVAEVLNLFNQQKHGGSKNRA